METYVFESIKRYFSLLQNYGYCNYDDVYKLLAVIFIQEMLNKNGKYYQYLCRKDKRALWRALNNIAGRCYILPFPDYPECACPDYEEPLNLDTLVIKVIGSLQAQDARDVLVVKVIGSAQADETEDVLVAKIK